MIVFAPVSSGGLYSHLRNVIPRLLSLRPDWHFEVHAPTEVLQTVFGRFDSPWMRLLPGHGRRGRLWWEFVHLPKLVRADRKALLWQPFGPFWNLALAPSGVVRLENLLVLLDPEERVVSRQDALRLRILRHVYLANARWALRPTCASFHSRARYVALTGLAPEHFAVIPHGVDSMSIEGSVASEEIDRVCRSRPFVLAVGQATPYRCTRELILAYRILVERSTADLPPLVWAGSARREDREYERECLELLGPLERQGKAVYLGQVAHQDVLALDRAACLFVHPSVHEDCPNTIFEAFAAGAPVICADIPATREFAADAAHFVSEPTPAALAAAIESVLADPSCRASLIRAGRERARMLTWDETARRFAATLDEAFAARSTQPRRSLRSSRV